MQVVLSCLHFFMRKDVERVALFLILGNISGFFAGVIYLVIGGIKSKRKLLFWQIIDIILYIMADIFLDGWSALLCDISLLVTVSLEYFNKRSVVFDAVDMTILCMSTLFITVLTGRWFEWLPLIGTVVITVYSRRNILSYKMALICASILFLLYSLYIQCYTTCVFNLLFIVFTSVSVVKGYKSAVYDDKSVNKDDL